MWFAFSYSFEKIEEIAKFLLCKTKHRPTVGIICGSGLSGLADTMEDPSVFPYGDIPDFPISTGKIKLRISICFLPFSHNSKLLLLTARAVNISPLIIFKNITYSTKIFIYYL